MTHDERLTDQCREEAQTLLSFLHGQRHPRLRLVTFDHRATYRGRDAMTAWYATRPHIHWLYTDDGSLTAKDFARLTEGFSAGQLECTEIRVITADEADRLNAQDWMIGARDEGLLITVRCTLDRYRRPEEVRRSQHVYAFNPILDADCEYSA